MNKEADKLSRKKILERFPTGRVELEEGFQLEHLLFSEKMAKKQKELNYKFRKINATTNILSFPLSNMCTETCSHPIPSEAITHPVILNLRGIPKAPLFP